MHLKFANLLKILSKGEKTRFCLFRILSTQNRQVLPGKFIIDREYSLFFIALFYWNVNGMRKIKYKDPGKYNIYLK